MHSNKKTHVRRIIFGRHKTSPTNYHEHPFIIVGENTNYFACVQVTTFNYHKNPADIKNNIKANTIPKEEEFSSNYGQIPVFLNNKHAGFYVSYKVEEKESFINSKFDWLDSNFSDILDQKSPIIDCGHKWFYVDKNLGLKNNSYLLLDKLIIFSKKGLNSEFRFLQKFIIDQKLWNNISYNLFNGSNLSKNIDKILNDLNNNKFN